ncbi:stage V sporulation protein R [Syntrophus gentianae]|uniref:Stage V sporulation protein R n=1 Tax=Syntrophus gentianae TaxID=43775 RepID=A0A1H7YHK9_9BACT|nr:SpoVR family protein [Syntrophus gentianae]SEM45600.1 stage V sporulation protein R [Syntrophus gentianae]
MELINQHTKGIMEGCKERARDAGLRFQNETLEYIVTNKDLLELGPKNMIPTLYDYWVHDVEVLHEKGKYELYPYNPYETVINTKPAISFYNDNNPDWLNVMIFYHVLAHIDFFQNNLLFRSTWDEDFTGQALADKRNIAMLRSEKGRWVDYVIEFTRGIDNLVDLFGELSLLNYPAEINASSRLNYYFDVFLQTVQQVSYSFYLKEIERYNKTLEAYGGMAESVFFSDTAKKYPEFEAMYGKQKREEEAPPRDLIQYLQEYSPFLQRPENIWMKTVMEIVRRTSLYFQPQIRTKILNEGWASYWHDILFMSDDRIKGNEVSYALVNAKVTALSRLGINPYALGMRLFSYLEDSAEKGRVSYEFHRLKDADQRRKYDLHTGQGRSFVFDVRENFTDFTFINTFVDQGFVDAHRLFVAGRRLNRQKGVWEYFVKSRKAEDYKQMLLNSLYHPPHVILDEEKGEGGSLYLNHQYEGKPLVKEYIANTLLGIEYLWGGKVMLETTELVKEAKEEDWKQAYQVPRYILADQETTEQMIPRRVLYTMDNRKLTRELL